MSPEQERANLSVPFYVDSREEAETAALLWIGDQPLITSYRLLRLWQPRADLPRMWRAEFDAQYATRKLAAETR